MGIQINGSNDTISATDGGISISGQSIDNANLNLSQNLNVTGVATVGTLNATQSNPTNINVSGVSTVTNLRATNINLSGITTGLNVSGVTTSSSVIVGSAVTISATGINAPGIGITIASINDGPISGARNRIINGDMRFDQRNAGVTTTPANDTTYTLDRWIARNTQASKYTIQQVSDAPAGFVNSLKVTSSSSYSVTSTDYFAVDQYIEGLNSSDLAWGTAAAKTVTMSFWVKSSLTGTFGGSVFSYQVGYPSYPFSYSISSANTWEYKTITIPGPTSGTFVTTSAGNIALEFSFGVGSTLSGTAGSWSNSTLYRSVTGAVSVVGTSSATWQITGVQFETGTVATPFERRSYGQELALCQRYFQKSYDIGTAVGTNTNSGRTFIIGRATGSFIDYCNTVHFPVRMRGTPTMKFYTTGGTADSWNNTSGSNPNPLSNTFSEHCFNIYVTDNTTVGQAGFAYGHWTASAEL
jgi:hypothetical protein